MADSVSGCWFADLGGHSQRRSANVSTVEADLDRDSPVPLYEQLAGVLRAADRPGAAPAWCGYHGAPGLQARLRGGQGHRDPFLQIGRGGPIAAKLHAPPRTIGGLPALERGEQRDSEQLEVHRGGERVTRDPDHGDRRDRAVG